MGFQKMKLLTGATLSVLLSAVAVYPASATPASSSASGERMSRMDDSMTVAQGTDGTNNTTDTTNTVSSGVRGRITSIVGDVVTIMLPDGTTQSVTVTKEDRTRLSLKEGMRIVVKRMGSSSNADVTVERADDTTTTDTTSTDTTSQQRLRGTITKIDGNQLTILTRPNDRSRTITVNQADIDRLNLRPGMEIVAMMGSDGMTTVDLASNVNSNIDRRTTIERRSTTSTTTTPASLSTDTTDTTTSPSTVTTDTTTSRSTARTDTSGSVQGGTVNPTRRTSLTRRRTHTPVRALW